MAALKVQMGRLEGALAAETRRRVDATTRLDELSRTQVYEVEERLKTQLQEDNTRLQVRLDALECRVARLEEKWEIEAENQARSVRATADDLNRAVTALRDHQATERKERLKREGYLLQQVEDHKRECQELWDKERQDRTGRLESLETQVASHEARLVLQQTRYEERIDEELAALRDELEAEVQERQIQDEEIVAAMNRYTQQLQHSLAQIE